MLVLSRRERVDPGDRAPPRRLPADRPAPPAGLDGVVRYHGRAVTTCSSWPRVGQLDDDARHDLAGRRRVGREVGAEDDELHGGAAEPVAPRRREGAYRRAHTVGGDQARADCTSVSSAARAWPAAIRRARRSASSSTRPIASAQPSPSSGSRSSTAGAADAPPAAPSRPPPTTGVPDGHRLQHGRAEPLVAAREDERVGAAQQAVAVARRAPGPVRTTRSPQPEPVDRRARRRPRRSPRPPSSTSRSVGSVPSRASDVAAAAGGSCGDG